jgi:predicted lysophospholipase L1 biosynthesis ABC-type transport system permease subunit
MWPIALPIASILLITLLFLYVPTVYIRKTNKLIQLLEKIEANTRKENK